MLKLLSTLDIVGENGLIVRRGRDGKGMRLMRLTRLMRLMRLMRLTKWMKWMKRMKRMKRMKWEAGGGSSQTQYQFTKRRV
ncbi:MAG: hypothetical protein AB9903_14145 [Vulcanimicrobiota bacterium]